MSPDIDLTRGGYGGDGIEEAFKPFTANHLEYWWHFREVLRSAQDKFTPHWWKRLDGQPLNDEEYRELIALSLANYAVYTSLAEALWFHGEFREYASRRDLFATRRSWKALYSSLYSSFVALCNLTYIVVLRETPFRRNRHGELWNYGPQETFNKVQGNALKSPIKRCMDRIEIRNHLDHYWTIWHGFANNTFMIDRNFKKGYIALDPKNDTHIDLDAVQQAEEHIVQSAQDFNLVYKELAVTGGYLDQYLAKRNWYIDYSDFLPPHNGKRPKP
jgi:hypothetical protein